MTAKRPTTGVMLLDRDRLSTCVQCGMCLISCPMYLCPELSLLLRQAKIDAAVANGARIIVTANPWCQLYLQAGTREKRLDAEVPHLAELLICAYGTRPGG